jgi:sugar/nucleoside kinase (ribokinase family)
VPSPVTGTPEFLVVGHLTRDMVGDDLRPGGTASYAAVVAARLGLRTGILTSAAADLDLPAQIAHVQVHRVPAPQSTVMEHRWFGRVREQYLRSRAATMTASDLPAAFRSTPIVLFGPVTGEIGPGLADAFPAALRGATVQGWLRRFEADGHMEAIDAATWDHEPLTGAVQAIFLSEEDLGTAGTNIDPLLDRWAARVPILAVTLGDQGARIAVQGRWHTIASMPANEVDGTGAGDAFAAAFLIRYHETANAGEAARFATAVAGFVVEAPGIAGAPSREQVEARLAAHPEVLLTPVPLP